MTWYKLIFQKQKNAKFLHIQRMPLLCEKHDKMQMKMTETEELGNSKLTWQDKEALYNN